MLRIIAIILTGILTSFFYFPMGLRFLPVGNTKLILATVGLVLLFISRSFNRTGTIDRKVIILAFAGFVVSLACVFALSVNGTNDMTYVTYVASMFVWMVSAYAVSSTIKMVHGEFTLPLATHYLVGVCVAQCIFAIWIDKSPWMNNVAAMIQGRDYWLESVNRIYGFGACLDTAGIRFSIALVLLGYLVRKIDDFGLRKWLPLYLGAFVVIAFIGNVMARTTSVGVLLFLAIVLWPGKESESRKLIFKWFGVVVVLGVVVGVYLYNTDPLWQKDIRFAFEGFFSLVEKGHWETSSNNKLATMVVWPDNLKTWVIGDGYFSDPNYTDPYYIGEEFEGYYQNTDIGYCRFIFYMGLIGLLAFSFFIACAAQCCISNRPEYKMLFLMLLLLNFIVWMKVSTDIFLIFGFLLFLEPYEKEDEEDVEEEEPLLKGKAVPEP